MRGHHLSIIAIALAVAFVLVAPNPASAYVGPGAGLELVPYFLALVGWVAAAFGSILLWPFFSLLRRWRGTKEEEKKEPGADAPATAEGQPAGHDVPANT